MRFTLPLPKQFAVQLGIGKGDFLDCQIDGNRLIVKKADDCTDDVSVRSIHRLIVEKYHSPVTNQTSVMAEDKNRFEIRSMKVAKNRIGSLQCAEAGHHCACCNEWNNNHNGM